MTFTSQGKVHQKFQKAVSSHQGQLYIDITLKQ